MSETSVSSKGGRRGRTVDAAAVEVAKDAKRRSRAAGAKGRADRGMTAIERAIRDSAIMAAVAAGESNAEIAQEFDLSARGVAHVVKRMRSRPSPMDKRPMEVLERLAQTYERAAVDAMRIAARTVEKQPHVALGAISRSIEMWGKFQELMVATGKMPENLEVFRGESELKQLTLWVLDALYAVRDGELEIPEAIQGIREKVREGELPVIEAKSSAR